MTDHSFKATGLFAVLCYGIFLLGLVTGCAIAAGAVRLLFSMLYFK